MSDLFRSRGGGSTACRARALLFLFLNLAGQTAVGTPNCPFVDGHLGPFINTDHSNDDITSCTEGTNATAAGIACLSTVGCVAFNVDFQHNHTCLKNSSSMTSITRTNGQEVCFYTGRFMRTSYGRASTMPVLLIWRGRGGGQREG
jgi:hypothetical protein